MVLLDWDLPSMGALDFLRGVGNMPEEEKPAIILCATENDPQQFTLAKAAGAAHTFSSRLTNIHLKLPCVKLAFLVTTLSILGQL